jgi:predicted phage terminase large subunit-like protein
MLLTSRGWLKISYIVDNKLDVKIAGYKNNRITWQKIEAYEKSDFRQCVEVDCGYTSFCCTEDHHVWTSSGYKAACELIAGEEIKLYDVASVRELPRQVTREERKKRKTEIGNVVSVKKVQLSDTHVYNVRVSPAHNYFVNGVLVHNCDDPNNVAESESKLILESTNNWGREVMPDRLSNMQEDAIVCIQQRTSEDDFTGTLLALEAGYEHLCIPMEYDPRRHCETSIGWSDPRTIEGELACPERFPQSVIDNLKVMKGPWAWASQYSQLPSPRGGGIVKADWWQLWPPQDSQHPEDGKLRYPMMDYIISVCDTAYTTKEENDPSACIVLGVFKLNGINKVMLMEAWSERLEFHDLKEKIVATCRKRKVDALIVEAKASGKSIAQEIRRLCSEQEFVVYDIAPDGGDKVARLHSVVPLFAAKTVYAPDKAWAQMVIDQTSSFPKGKHDDLVDCVSMGLSYLRKSGIAMMPDEGERIVVEELQWMPDNNERLYDV